MGASPSGSHPVGSASASRPGGSLGRIIALLLAILVASTLIVWTIIPPQNRGYGRVTIIGTIVAGQVALTAIDSVTGCTPWSNGTAGGDLYGRFAYRLVNLGDSEFAATVIIARDGYHVVAQQPYVLAPHEAVRGTIRADVAYLGTCPAVPLALGLSIIYPG